MQELIKRLRSYLPLWLGCHWSQASKDYAIAADLIESQAAEIAELKGQCISMAMELTGVPRYKALCDQMGDALHFSHEETKGWYEEITGEDYNSPIINEALEAWRAMK